MSETKIGNTVLKVGDHVRAGYISGVVIAINNTGRIIEIRQIAGGSTLRDVQSVTHVEGREVQQ